MRDTSEQHPHCHEAAAPGHTELTNDFVLNLNFCLEIISLILTLEELTYIWEALKQAYHATAVIRQMRLLALSTQREKKETTNSSDTNANSTTTTTTSSTTTTKTTNTTSSAPKTTSNPTTTTTSAPRENAH
ncbi:hypothetical protein E2C01_019723 [Portunus trituberculatus]|uniref:Uncharacterized protein n=1 Tax=Portunus trituberculatus TaxID=210409 RepID=A0A5B7DZM4_PORTR|nr:hypothetical protein [Portunus trituberculatus]